MIVREATLEDTEAIVALGLEFLESSPYAGLAPGEPDAIAGLVAAVIEHGEVFVAVVDGAIVGMIALLMVPHIFSSTLHADEVAWFVKPAHRGRAGVRLLEHAERWAVQNHAKLIKMVAPEGSEVGSLYRRKGYRPIETAFIKVLEHGDRHCDNPRPHRSDGIRHE